jgi:DNA polymerase elongation subunit (family B)
MELAQSFVFNITNWHESHDEVYEETSDDEQSEDSEKPKKKSLVYSIKLYGRTATGDSVYLNVRDYKPHFYIEVPIEWDDIRVATLVNHIKDGVKKQKGDWFVAGFDSFNIVMRKRLYGFTGHKDFKFVRLIFTSAIAFGVFNKWISKNKIDHPVLFTKPKKVKLYESNIKPFLRFMHMQQIDPCGWVSVTGIRQLPPVSHCKFNLETHWKNVTPTKVNSQPKLLIASFDIECDSYTGDFPNAKTNYGIDPNTGEEVIGDKIIQIGTAFSWGGCDEPHDKTIITLKGCTQIKDLESCEIIECETEADVLLEWTKVMNSRCPDYLIGFNINEFDFEFMHDRAEHLGIIEQFEKFCKLKGLRAKYDAKKLESSAMGENHLKFYEPFGINVIDLYKWFQRETKHESYKLDKMSAYYIREKIDKKNTTYDATKNQTTIITASTYGIYKNQYVSILYEDSLTDSVHDEKFQVKRMAQSTTVFDKKGKPMQQLVVQGKIPDELFADCYTLYWCHAKDDMPAKEMFKRYRGSDDDRALVAKYCVQDCVLVTKLIEKLKIIGENIAMANVCSVPIWWLFFRGQSAKILSLVSRECAKHKFMLPTPKNTYDTEGINDSEEEEEETGYEGATVIEPITGIHEDPIVVLDFASLYPSSMLYMNISHETFVNDEAYRGLSGYTYRDVSFTNKDGTTTTCTFAKKDDGSIGIIPLILQNLLEERKAYKNKMKYATTAFEYDQCDATQKAYKLTANSVYGQVGASVGPIYLKELAASTTATGRIMLHYSQTFIEGDFATLVNLAINDEQNFYKHARTMFAESDDKKFANHLDKKFPYKNKEEFYRYFYDKINEIFPKTVADNGEMQIQNVKPKIIYGDTDSVFFTVQIHNKGEQYVQTDKIALAQSIQVGQLAGETIYKVLPEPQEQVYEKTMYPLILLKKKRYIGNLYEDDPEHFKLKVMGIELKRRGNAKIVKIFLGGLVDFMLNTHSAKLAVKYVREQIKKMLRGGFPIDKFIISKNLKSTYANRRSQCHAVLADRIAERTGTPVVSNERIPYVYVITKNPKKGEKLLQGDRIEDPNYVIENNIEIDYLFYLTNQIREPCMKFLELITDDPNKIFDDFIRLEETRRRKMNLITDFLGVVENDDEDSEEGQLQKTTKEPRNREGKKSKGGFVIEF